VEVFVESAVACFQRGLKPSLGCIALSTNKALTLTSKILNLKTMRRERKEVPQKLESPIMEVDLHVGVGI